MRAPNMGRRLYSAVMFVLVSVVGGVLVAGLVVPAASVGAELAKAGAIAVQALPREVETPPPAEGSTVLMADGSVLTSFFNENRVNVPLSEISEVMRQAQISVEDQRFYDHGALDLRGTLRALVRTSSGNKQGGSTLTQQYVKLALVDKAVADNDKEALAAARERTFSRKLLELRYAIALEDRLSKDEILERYLNLAYYGAGAYGVEAAARRYFGISASELNLAQSAMLAGLVRNPVTTDPIRYEKLAIERRNNVLDVMAGQGVITAEQAKEAKAEEFDRSKITEVQNGCVSSEFPHLCSVVEKTLLQMPSLGGGTTSAEQETARRMLKRGGLVIQTEIDPRTQRAAQDAVSNYVYPTDPVIGVIAMIEPGTGLIKAIAQSRPEIGKAPGQTYWTYAMEKNLGGAEGYFGGSTYKLFTIAAAVAKGFPPGRSYESPRVRDWGGERFSTCEGSIRAEKGWDVRGVGGTFDLYSGTKNSVNNFFVALEQDVGLCDVTRMARTLGLNIAPQRANISTDESWRLAQNPAFTLGTENSSPISLANAYATIAARGMRCDPIILKSVTGKDGREYEVPNANCQQVIPQEVADRVTDIFRGPFNGGTATAANIPGYSIAGKTGTDTNAPTIWTVGFTPQLATAAMLTVDKKADRYLRGQRSIEGAPIRGGKARLAGSSGREAGGGLWKPAMAVALQGLPKGQFVKPKAYKPEVVDLPSCSSLNDCRQKLRDAGFGTAVTRVTNSAPAGRFLGISPKGRAPQYSTIKLLVSAGPAPKPSAKPSTEPNPNPNPSTAPAPPNEEG
ncbi:MAG: transglycosylase domain-containing protein [Propioniciclava sp.]|uniref:transglycosylase domain-containing protein n=1 Tax=Propioniciclava sp. TaxID=2038686 RepID=UPI0039E64043